MGMQLPEWARKTFQIATGDGWPEADEDALWALAREWATIGGAIDALQYQLMEPARAVRRTDWDGPAARAFALAGQAPAGRQLAGLATGSHDVSGFIHQTGVNVQYMKIIVLQELVLLAAQIAQLLGLSGATFGASLTAIPALAALGRLLARLATYRLSMWIMSLAMGEAMQLAIDSIAQAAQLAAGTRRHWDEALTANAAITGAVSGVLGPIAQGAAGRLFDPGRVKGALGSDLTAGVRQVVGSAAHEYLTSGVTGAVTGQGWTGSPWDLTAGATEGTVEAFTRIRRRHGGLPHLDTPPQTPDIDTPAAHSQELVPHQQARPTAVSPQVDENSGIAARLRGNYNPQPDTSAPVRHNWHSDGQPPVHHTADTQHAPAAHRPPHAGEANAIAGQVVDPISVSVHSGVPLASRPLPTPSSAMPNVLPDAEVDVAEQDKDRSTERRLMLARSDSNGPIAARDSFWESLIISAETQIGAAMRRAGSLPAQEPTARLTAGRVRDFVANRLPVDPMKSQQSRHHALLENGDGTHTNIDELAAVAEQTFDTNAFDKLVAVTAQELDLSITVIQEGNERQIGPMGSQQVRLVQDQGIFHPIPPQRSGNELPAAAQIGEKYRGEEDPNNPKRFYYPRTVHYFSPEEREACRLFVDADGALRRAADGALFDTSTGNGLLAKWLLILSDIDSAGCGLFVMDGHGNLYGLLTSEVGRRQHSSILAGGPVAGAGEITVRNGRLIATSDTSGHYRPTAEMNDRVLQCLRNQGLRPAPEFQQYDWGGRER